MSVDEKEIRALARVIGDVDADALRSATFAWVGSADADAAVVAAREGLERHYADARAHARRLGFADACFRGDDHHVVGFVAGGDGVPRGFLPPRAGVVVPDGRTRQGKAALLWMDEHNARRDEAHVRDREAVGIRGHHFFTVTSPRFMFGSVRPTIVRGRGAHRPLAYVAGVPDIEGIVVDPAKWTAIDPAILRAVADI